MNLQKVGKFIAKMRKKVGMTQSELGEALGVSGKAVSKWERGVNAPDITILVDLAKLLNVSATEILVGEKMDNNITTEDANEIAISSISTYNNYSKKKYMKIIIILITVIVLISTVFFTTYFITNYNKCFVYKLSSANDGYYLEGLVASNQKENSIIISGIKINNDIIIRTNEIDNYVVELRANKMELYRNNYVYDNSIGSLSNIINNTNIIIDSNQISSWNEKTFLDNKKNKIEVIISFYDNQKEIDKISIPVEIEKKYSNDKLFY